MRWPPDNTSCEFQATTQAKSADILIDRHSKTEVGLLLQLPSLSAMVAVVLLRAGWWMYLRPVVPVLDGSEVHGRPGNRDACLTQGSWESNSPK